MYELTEEWLEKVNKRFSMRDIPYRERPWLAWGEWAKLNKRPIAITDPVVDRIFSWFEKNTRAGSQQIGQIYTGVYYYDSCFWPIVVPIIFGAVTVDVSDSLETMPEEILKRLWQDRDKFIECVFICADCFDYAFGFESINKIGSTSKFAQELLDAGDQHLKATVSLLLDRSPNSKSIESARMSIEMFLKAFSVVKVGLTDKDAKQKIGHNLEKALNKCLDADPNSELKTILTDLKMFPEVDQRYKGTIKTPKELWQSYKVAQFVGSTVIRSFTGRDIRKTIQID